MNATPQMEMGLDTELKFDAARIGALAWDVTTRSHGGGERG